MITNISALLVPLALIAGGYYIRIAKDREPFAGPNTWKWIMGIGLVSFIVELISLVIKYT